MDFVGRGNTKWKMFFVVITRVAISRSVITVNHFFFKKKKKAIRKEKC